MFLCVWYISLAKEVFTLIKVISTQTELYQVENKVHGKVYSASQIVKFNFEGNSVSPVTHSTSYVFTGIAFYFVLLVLT